MEASLIPILTPKQTQTHDDSNENGAEVETDKSSDTVVIAHCCHHDEENDKLKLELFQAKQQISEQANQLKSAHEKNSAQNEQFIEAAKFLVEHQRFVANAEEQNRQAKEMKTKLLEQIIQELECEKQLRKGAEVKIGKLEASLKSMKDELSSVIGTINRWDEETGHNVNDEPLECDGTTEHENSQVSEGLYILQQKLATVSAQAQEKLDKHFKNQKERRRELVEITQIIGKLAEAATKKSIEPCSSNVPPMLPKKMSPLTTISSSLAATSSRILRKRKPSDSLSNPPPTKKRLLRSRQSIIPNLSNVDLDSREDTNVDMSSVGGDLVVSSSNGQVEEDGADTMAHGVHPSNPNCLTCICGYVTKSKTWLRYHIKLATTTPKFHCEKCDRKFVLCSQLKIHYKSEHGITCKFSNGCRLCGTVFQSRSELTSHLMKVHQSSSSMVTEPAIKQDRHGRDRTKLRDEYYCLCGRKFNVYATLSWHIRRQRNLYNFKCTKCPIKFNVHIQLKKHLLNAHKVTYERNAKYGCHQCGQTFSILTQLVTHRKRDHMYSKKKLSPEATGQEGRDTSNSQNAPVAPPLDNNLADLPSVAEKTSSHGPDPTDQGRSSCICGKKYNSELRLKAHIRYFRHGPRYPCDKCGEHFMFRSNLKIHYKSNHKKIIRSVEPSSSSGGDESVEASLLTTSESGANSKSCNGASTNPMSERMEGQRGVTGRTIEQEHHSRDRNVPKGTFKCTCGKVVLTSYGLYIHIKTKSNPSVFECSFCPKKFVEHGGLKKHIRRVHNADYDGFACWRCRKIFPTFEELVQHRKIHQ